MFREPGTLMDITVGLIEKSLTIASSVFFLSLTHPAPASGRRPSLRETTLYTHLLEKETMVNGQENGLKGQHNLAQGKRSVALG